MSRERYKELARSFANAPAIPLGWVGLGAILGGVVLGVIAALDEPVNDRILWVPVHIVSIGVPMGAVIGGVVGALVARLRRRRTNRARPPEP